MGQDTHLKDFLTGCRADHRSISLNSVSTSFPKGGLNSHRPLRRDCKNTPLRLEKVLKPSSPWYCPMPLAPTPPNGSSSWAMWSIVSLTVTPPAMESCSTRSMRARS